MTVDLFITHPSTSHPPRLALDRDTPIAAFIRDAAPPDPNEHFEPVALKLLVPVTGGHVMRSDLLELRLQGCLLAGHIASFTKPRQNVSGCGSRLREGELEALRNELEMALGAVQVRNQENIPLLEAAELLEQEMRNRLSLAWFSSEPIPAKRIAFVKPARDMLGFAALKALGISLIVLDAPGSWMADDHGPHAHLRERFIQFNPNPDTGFKDRLREAVALAQVDGIMTSTPSECLLVSIAEVCEELGLPTAPSAAFRNGTDKYAQRRLVDGGELAVRVESAEKLRARLDAGLVLPSYPLVVKPARLAGLSQCVSLVSNDKELFAAVEKIKGRIVGYESSVPIVSEALIEPYESGPEVDANMVLCDGQLLYCEISDDFPSAADRDGATLGDDFQETMFLYPSRLPAAEQEILRLELHRAVLRLGFTSGVFHVEARVRNSSMHYARQPDSEVDLVERPAPPPDPPGVFLIEVNARPPGYIGLMTIAYTYGVDYYALWGLNAIGDTARFKALSQSFLNGPQYTSALVLILPERGGTLVSDDPAPALRRLRPDLMEKIPLYRNLFSRGDRVPDPLGPWNTFTSCVMVISRSGRQDLLQTVKEIRREWKPEIV